MTDARLSAEKIGAHLGIAKDTVHVLIADRALPAHRVGRLWKFRIGEVDKWVRGSGAAKGSVEVPQDRDA